MISFIFMVDAKIQVWGTYDKRLRT